MDAKRKKKLLAELSKIRATVVKEHDRVQAKPDGPDKKDIQKLEKLADRVNEITKEVTEASGDGETIELPIELETIIKPALTDDQEIWRERLRSDKRLAKTIHGIITMARSVPDIEGDDPDIEMLGMTYVAIAALIFDYTGKEV